MSGKKNGTKRVGSYFKSNHQNTKPMDVVVREIATEVAISFTHSQYDTRPSPHHQSGKPVVMSLM